MPCGEFPTMPFGRPWLLSEAEEAVPGHVEIDNRLVEKICKRLEIRPPGK